MKLGIVTTVAAVLSWAVLMGSMTFAEAANSNQRQRNQKQRIRQGVRSGELTRHEVKRLEREQTHIQRDEAWAKSDGLRRENGLGFSRNRTGPVQTSNARNMTIRLVTSLTN
jgi:Ni/Co efflux regulator RcnB